jgi:hypothetical protein
VLQTIGQKTTNRDARVSDAFRTTKAMQPTGMGTSATYRRRMVLPFIGPIAIRHLRAAATGLLALSLLAPFGAILFLQEPTESCGMSCCRGIRCSCHRMDPGEGHGDPAWSAAPACGSECARHIGFPGSPSITLSAAWIRVGFTPGTESLRFTPKPAYFSVGTEFALFGRPPPPTCS